MASWDHSTLLTGMMGETVVVDLKSTYVCLGTLVSCDEFFLELRDADLHDFRDSSATREVYVYDSARLGIRRNRARVLIRLDDVIALTHFTDIAES
jgi:small nuclear ribonucleoprotein (snRNP)-like protein